jgi:hypothetical protein
MRIAFPLTTLAIALAVVTSAIAAEPPTISPPKNPHVNKLTPEEEQAGWKLLFDGKSTEGWRVYNKKDAGSWTVKDGALYLEKPGSGDLMTADKYADFELSLDWKFETGNNSGVIYRVVETKGPSYITGPELQVMPQKSTDKLGKNSGGSLYDLYAPTVNSFPQITDPDYWINYKVVAKGKHLEHWVQGQKVVECDIGSDDWNSRYAGSKWAKQKEFAAAAEGHIALQDHGAKIMFRSVKLRVLK